MSVERSAEILARIARFVAADGFDRGLKPVQWQALQFLAKANRFSRTPGGLAAWLGQTKGTVSQTVSALVDKCLVERQGDLGDLRVVRLQLTKIGRELVAQRPPPIASRLISALDPQMQARLGLILDEMLHSMLATNNYRAFGLCRTCRHYSQDGAAAGFGHCALLNVPLLPGEGELICIEQEAA